MTANGELCYNARKYILKSMVGIYIVRNSKTNDCYIGASEDIFRRWKDHCSIAFNKESNNYNGLLYQNIREYGLDNFSFQILEECICEDLLERERFYFDLFEPRYNCYRPIEYPLSNQEVKDKHRANVKAGAKKAWESKSDSSKRISLSNLENGTKWKYIKRRVKAINIETGEESVFESLYKAAQSLNTSRSTICQVLNPNHPKKQSRGYVFEYC